MTVAALRKGGREEGRGEIGKHPHQSTCILVVASAREGKEGGREEEQI